MSECTIMVASYIVGIILFYVSPCGTIRGQLTCH